MKKTSFAFKASLLFVIIAIFSDSCMDNNEQNPQSNTILVSTDRIFNITASTAISGGVINLLDTASVYACGICWSVNPSPSVVDSTTTDSLFSGHFSSAIKNLSAGTKYYARAYVTNSFGTTYGNTQIFKTKTMDIATISIQADSFVMGQRNTGGIIEIAHTVFLNSYKIGQFEITNKQYAHFLNQNNIGANGLYPMGRYPTETLIYESTSNHDWGLHYSNNLWTPVLGYENHPVINVTWFGAFEFAAYVDGRLPTEAEWEYACRFKTTYEPFYTGYCLTNDQANYDWAYPYPYLLKTFTTDHNPYSTCVNSSNVYPGKTQAVGSYPPNGYELYEMYGNVSEWCNDWYDQYPTTPQINPQGPSEGFTRILRGGCWSTQAQYCCTTYRDNFNQPTSYSPSFGFRVIINE